ncbi:MAG TPA: hypothetical protein VMS87_10475 [Roseiarcus sp.]|nr:hypothetical protein [Roseiarcus sp.]
MSLARLVFGLGLAALPGIAVAEDPAGCGGFKWPLERERAALLKQQKPSLANGGALAYDVPTALKLAPLSDANLPQPPERAAKFEPSYAGHFTLPQPAKPGVYKITLSSYAWIDVLDNGKFLHPRAFSGATACEGARKSVKFDLPARALGVQISGVEDREISLIVSPAE